MNPHEAETLAKEDEFGLWLAACDERFAAGDCASSPDEAGVPEALRPRLEQQAAWCQLVRQIWPHAALGDLSTETSAPRNGPSSAEPSPVGLDRFVLREELGRGSFGVVYRAYDPRLRRELALKVPRAEALVTPELRARFQHEAMAAAGLDHPNIVPVYEAGEEGSVCFIASAYCPGMTLAAWLRARPGPVPYRLAAELVATVADAVEYAHRRGVLHRDLKPSNLMLEIVGDGALESAGDGSALVPRITDFGLAKLVEIGPGDTIAANRTQSGVIMGTPSYMAPEQADGRAGEVGPAADIYSLGVILYEMLTGRPPFQEDSALDTLVLVRTQDPISPSRLRPRLPRDLETICLKCLHKQPHGRYPSAGALADDLRRFLAAEPIHARPIAVWERALKWTRRHPAVTALAGAGTIAAIALAVVIGVTNLRLKHERDRAEARRLEAVANLRKARNAVDRMLTRVSEVRLKDVPQVEPVRRALLEDALEFYRDFARQSHDDPEVLHGVSLAYARLARSYAESGWFDRCERCCLEALALQNQLAVSFPAVATYRWAMARSLYELASLQNRLGRNAEAADILRKSLALLETLTGNEPNEPRYRSEQAAAHDLYGIAINGPARGGEAAAEFRTAIALLDELAARFPGDRTYPARAAVARSNLAGALIGRGELEAAETVLRQLLEFWQRQAKSEPDDANARSKLALTLDNLAHVLAKSGRKPEVEQAICRALDIRLTLTKDFPNTPWHFLRSADDLALLADLATDRGDLAQARRLLQQALASRGKALALAPQNSAYLASARAAYAALIETLIRLHAHDDATKAIAEYVALSPSSGPDCFRAGSFQARCVPLAAADARLTPTQRADLAKVYADQAIAILRESEKRGHRNAGALRKDPSFDPLRDRTDFGALVAASAASPAASSP